MLGREDVNMGHKKEDMVKESNLTYDDYASMPDDGNRYELAAGHLELMSPAPTPNHQVISSQLFNQLSSFCEKNFVILYSPIDVILAKNEVRQPDIIMISRERLSIVTDRGIEGPPDLIVEILSPSTALKDRKTKKTVYASFGVTEYWIVDPVHETIEQWIQSDENKKEYQLLGTYGENDIITSPFIKCLEVSAADVFNHPLSKKG